MRRACRGAWRVWPSRVGGERASMAARRRTFAGGRRRRPRAAAAIAGCCTRARVAAGARGGQRLGTRATLPFDLSIQLRLSAHYLCQGLFVCAALLLPPRLGSARLVGAVARQLGSARWRRSAAVSWLGSAAARRLARLGDTAARRGGVTRRLGAAARRGAALRSTLALSLHSTSPRPGMR